MYKINNRKYNFSGLALANVFQTATFIPYVTLLKNEFRARFNSIERICEYINVSILNFKYIDIAYFLQLMKVI